MSITRVLTAIPFSNRPPVQDIVANLHSYFTFNLLIGLAILLSYKQFGGRPIECMTPIGFTSAWNQYAENYCYSADTYYVSIDKAEQIIVNFSETERKERRISYYQWIPFFLVFQAACFKLPALVWKYFHGQSGMKVGEILRISTSEANSDPAVRSENINSLRSHLQKVLKFHHRLTVRQIRPHKFFRLLNMKYSSYYVTLVYLSTKFFFFINVTAQMNILHRYLFKSTTNLYGLQYWQYLLQWNLTHWKETGIFPRITWCDFDVREMGQSVNHTVQCVLVLNIFTEKAFVLLSIWYMVLTALTLANLTSWCFGYFSRASAEHFIFNHLEMSGESLFEDETERLPKEIQRCVARFIEKYLRTDGLFILRLIAQHADVVFSTELIYQMWKCHYEIEKQREALKRSKPLWQRHLLALEKMSPKKKARKNNDDELQEETYFVENTIPKMGSSRWGSLSSLDESIVMK